MYLRFSYIQPRECKAVRIQVILPFEYISRIEYDEQTDETVIRYADGNGNVCSVAPEESFDELEIQLERQRPYRKY